MGLTRASVSLREYGSFAEIRDMIARTAFAQLRFSFCCLVVTLIGLFVTFWMAWILSSLEMIRRGSWQAPRYP